MPVISCTMKDGSPGYKVENTSGCPHKTREAAEKQLAAIKINKEKRGKAEVIKWTTPSQRHIHSWMSGDMETTYVDGHSHKVINGVIQPDPDDGHTHDWFIPNDEGPKDGNSPQDKHKDPNKEVFKGS